MNQKTIITGGIVALLAYVYLKKEAKQTAAAIGAAINPLDRNNIFNRGTNAVGGVLTGNKNFKLGSWIYDITHGGH